MAATATNPKGSTPIFKRKWQLPFPLNIYQSSVGRKWVMALTGIGLLGFVIVHMIGNLHKQFFELYAARRNFGAQFRRNSDAIPTQF